MALINICSWMGTMKLHGGQKTSEVGRKVIPGSEGDYGNLLLTSVFYYIFARVLDRRWPVGGWSSTTRVEEADDSIPKPGIFLARQKWGGVAARQGQCDFAQIQLSRKFFAFLWIFFKFQKVFAIITNISKFWIFWKNLP